MKRTTEEETRKTPTMRVGEIFEEFQEKILALITPEKLKFEDENFSVDSTGWTKIISPNGVAVLESLEKDAWEYLKCDAVPDKLVGQQLFTQDSAIIRVIKVGKRLPTDEEFTRLLKTKDDIPNLVFAGYRNPSGSFYGRGSSADIWSSSESWKWYLKSGDATVYQGDSDKLHGLSVRCVSRTD